jgi:hypothetical protein
MAVLVEAISVVIRRSRIESAYPGGWERFVADCPNETLCADGDLARIGFMTPADVESYVRGLGEMGLVFQQNGKAIDIAVVDQRRGPTISCSWLAFDHLEINGNCVAASRLAGSAEQSLVTPQGWVFDDSLSATYGFIPTGAEHKSLRFLRHENGVDVYLNTLTGREVFVGRAGGKS